jgi:hypothetical protein
MKLVILVAILLALSLASTGCSSWREVDVGQASRSPGGTRIVVYFGCFSDPRIRVEETEQEVRVLVTTRSESRGDCGGKYEIILSEPLGDRLLIDESDGEPVIVELDESLPDAP